jgi:phosphate transport system protein
MERRLREELDLLKQHLLNMAATVEANIAQAVEGLRDRDGAVLEDAVRRDAEVDRAELRVDEACISLLARHQPVARDLRFVATALKIVKDIERVGDIAKSIARHGLSLLAERPMVFPTELGRMARVSQALLRRALDSFVHQDSDLARRVIREDDEVDELHRENTLRFVDMMRDDPALIGTLTRYLWVSKLLERVGDHGTNIAAMVVYLVEGRDIRHPKKRRAASE